jgi:hypothetical protein
MGQTSLGIFPDLIGDSLEHMAAAIAGGAGQPACSAARAAQQRGHGQAGESEARNGDRKPGELLAAIELGLPAGVERRPFFAAHGVDQHTPATSSGNSSAKRRITSPPKECPTRM